MRTNGNPFLDKGSGTRGEELRAPELITTVKLHANSLIENLPGPPFDLDCPEIRSSIGINQIRYTDSASVHGRVFWQDSGYTIEIASNLTKQRRSFTLAHEIAHTFFQLPGGQGIERNRKPNLPKSKITDEESLCDIAAAEMLMPAHARILGFRITDPSEMTKPRNAFISRVCDYGPSVRSILLLAREFGTSLAATSRRFAEMAIWRCHVSFWKLERDGEVSFSYGFASRASVSILAGSMAPGASILCKVIGGGQFLRGWSNIGLTTRMGAKIDRCFVEAVFLPQTQTVMAMAVLEENPGVHCKQVEKYARAKRGVSGQRSLTFRDPGMPDLD
jgi:Zn-dependent peptidase ImmA (M78 family)